MDTTNRKPDVDMKIEAESNMSKYTVDFENKFRRIPEPQSASDVFRKRVKKSCSKRSLVKSFIGNFPFLTIMRNYRITHDLPSDVIAGMTVGIMQIPQGMAYANLATLPPICGLYTSLFAPLIYFFFASSRHASMGCIAVVSLMTAAVLETSITDSDLGPVLNVTANETLSGLDTDNIINAKKIEIATALTLISGLVMMVLGKLGCGFVTTYMSEYLISGFTSGVAIHVLTSQIKNVLGLKIHVVVGVFKIIKTWIEIFKNIGSCNWVPVVTSAVSMIIIYIIKTQINERFRHRLRIPLPIELIVVIIGTGVSYAANFQGNFDVKVMGVIPAGIPEPRLPDVSLVTDHIGNAVIIGVIAFAQSVSMAKTLATKNKYSVNSNQEMFAYGAGSVLCSFFSGYIPACSVARSVVQEGAGGITQIAGVAGSVVVLVVVLAVGPLFYSLPSCILSAIIIVNLRSMFKQTLQVPSLWRQSKCDCSIWLVTFCCVVLLDADLGLGIGIIYSIASVVVRTQRSGFVSLGQVDGTKVYKSQERYTQVQLSPRVKILRYESPLYFANSEQFIRGSYTAAGINPELVKKDRTAIVKIRQDKDKLKSDTTEKEPVQNGGINEHTSLVDLRTVDGLDSTLTTLVFDMSGVSFIDTMGTKALEHTVTEYKSIDVTVYLVGLREEVIETLQRTGFMDRHKDSLLRTLEDALD